MFGTNPQQLKIKITQDRQIRVDKLPMEGGENFGECTIGANQEDFSFINWLILGKLEVIQDLTSDKQRLREDCGSVELGLLES